MPEPVSMASWLIPAVASGVGSLFTNQSNRAMSREQMRFQERMSSTAAQRAVKDYAAAGLNPALAYDRPASSPGGSSAQMENPVEKGVSSALAARQAAAQVKLTEAQALKTNEEAGILAFDRALRSTTTGDEPTWMAEMMARRRAALRDMQFTGEFQPGQLRGQALDNLLKGLQVPRSSLFSGMFEDAGALRTFIRSGMSSAGEASEAFKAWLHALGSIARGENARLRNFVFPMGGPRDRFGLLDPFKGGIRE